MLDKWLYIVLYFLYGLCFKVYFVWYEYCDPRFLVISVCMKYLFSSPHIQSLCVLCPKVGLLYAAYCRRLLFYLVCHSRSFDWSTLTFKLIIDRYVFIAILNLVFHLILYFFFVYFSFLYFLLWCDDFFCIMLVFFLFSCESVVCFWFVVTLFFKCVNLFLYLLPLNW